MSDTGRLIRYIKAEIDMANLYEQEKKWHTYECNCQRCRDIDEWMKLPWWRRLAAKLSL